MNTRSLFGSSLYIITIAPNNVVVAWYLSYRPSSFLSIGPPLLLLLFHSFWFWVLSISTLVSLLKPKYSTSLHQLAPSLGLYLCECFDRLTISGRDHSSCFIPLAPWGACVFRKSVYHVSHLSSYIIGDLQQIHVRLRVYIFGP